MKLIQFCLLTAVSLLLSACSLTLADDITPPPGSQQEFVVDSSPAPTSIGPLYPLVAPDPKKGEGIYADKCAPCHGESGQGDGPQAFQLPNPTTAIGSAAVARSSTPAEWYKVVSQGNLDRFMPPFPSLSDRQRWDVISYVYSLSISPETLAQGQDVYLENCSACHGENGRGDGPQSVSLSRSLPDFTDQSFMSKKSSSEFFQVVSSGLPPEMPAYSTILSESERWSVASYLRFLSFSPQGPLASPPTSSTPAAVSEDVTDESEAASGYGLITGQVVNGSGGDLLTDIPVTLHGFDGMQVVVTDTVETDAFGFFVFENIELPANRIYLATAELGNATYASQFLTVQEDTQTLELNITVYETTTELTHLFTDRMHIFLDFSSPGVVQVIELYIMSNLGRKTIVGTEAGGPVAEFPLPEGAMNLQFQDGVLGERYVEVPGGFADTRTLPPTQGEYQVLFGYELPYDRKLDFRLPLNTAVDQVVILQPESGVKIRSDQLKDSGPRDVQGVAHQMFVGGPFDMGSELVLNISGRPSSGPILAASSNQNLVYGLGAFGFVMIAAGVWLYRRNQTPELDEIIEEEAEEESLDDLDREHLIEAIIALDDLYQEGELPEKAYRKRRADLKMRLKEVSE
jgi:mono/diheme cytochrome c family protein